MAWKGGFSGKGYAIGDFKALLETYPAVPFAKFVVIHNTDFLIDKADAYGKKHGYGQRIKNLEHYYKNEKKWASGPHGFIEPDGKFYPGTPLNTPGTGSPSWNGSAWHLEIEADFDVDDPTSGLGLQTVEMTAHVAALLLRKQKLPATNSTIRFHKEDTATTHNCPGPKLRKDWFLAKVQSYMDGDKPVDLPPEGKAPEFAPKEMWSTSDVQAHLIRLGYDPGPVDGIKGPKTETAIKAFQKAMGVFESGVVGSWVWNKLRTLQAPSKPPVASEEPSGDDPNKLKGRDRPLYVKRVLQELGWKDFQAAAMVGQLMRESYPDLRTQAIGDEGTAFGIGQWRLDRRENLLKQAKTLGKDPHDLDLQARFVDWELRNTEKYAGNLLKASTNLHEALLAGISYERPRGYTKNNPMNGDGWDARKKFAESIL